jgi:hypothetical protein
MHFWQRVLPLLSAALCGSWGVGRKLRSDHRAIKRGILGCAGASNAPGLSSIQRTAAYRPPRQT